MGFITNQWLKKNRRKARGHSPVEVTITPEVPWEKWDSDHGVVAVLNAGREDDTYQYLFLTQADVDMTAPFLVKASSATAQKEVAICALVGLSDRDLSKVLEELYGRRRASGKR